MRYVGATLIMAAAWFLYRLAVMDAIQRERARLEDQHDAVSRYRQAGVR